MAKSKRNNLMKTNNLIVSFKDIYIIRYALENYFDINVERCSKDVNDYIFLKDIISALVNVKICEEKFYEKKAK